MIDPEAFQRNLRGILKKKGLTQKAFAELTGHHIRTINQWCNGVLPCADNLALIAKYLDVSADDLLKGMIK